MNLLSPPHVNHVVICPQILNTVSLTEWIDFVHRWPFITWLIYMGPEDAEYQVGEWWVMKMASISLGGMTDLLCFLNLPISLQTLITWPWLFVNKQAFVLKLLRKKCEAQCEGGLDAGLRFRLMFRVNLNCGCLF